MAENAGGIYYVIDAQTNEAINAIKLVKAENQTLGNSFNDLDKKVNQFNNSTKKMGKSAAQASQDLKNVGYQVTDIGVQLAPILGANGIVLAGIQQLSQIGQIFNPLAAGVFALAGAFAGPYLSSLFESEEASDKLDETLKSLNETIVMTEGGVNVLSNEFAAMAKQSVNLAKAQLALASVKADQAIDLAADAARNAVNEFDTFFGALSAASTPEMLENLNETLERTGMTLSELIDDAELYGTGLTQLRSAAQNLSEELGTTTEQSIKVIEAFNNFKQDESAENLKALADVVSDVALNTKSATPEVKQLAVTLQQLSVTTLDAAEKQKVIEAALKDLSGALKANTEDVEAQRESMKSLADQLEVQASSIGKTSSEILVMRKETALARAESIGLNEETMKSIELSFDRIIASEREAEALKARAQAARDAAQAERESRSASRGFIEGFGLEGEQEMFEDNPDSQATGISRAIIQENMTLMEQLENQRGMIQLYQELEVGDAEAHAEALIAIDKKIADEKRKNNQAMLSASSDFFGASADLVSAFAGEQSGAYKALFAVSKGFAIANAALQMQTAIANASAVPWPANIPAIAQAVALGGQIASSIASISYGGGRATGGPVNANSFYRMGEGNRPEVMQTGAGLFAVPGDKGRVFNGSQLDKIGGNGSSNVIINNYSGMPATQQVNESGDIEITIGELVNQMDNHSGAFYDSLMRNTDANAKLGM